MQPPNILFLFADQHRFDCLGVNGHPVLETPHLDRLAGEGMNFTHAFCPIPLCVPTRISLLNGTWPITHRSLMNWDTEAACPTREDLPTFTVSLRQQNYFLGWVGKWQTHPKKDPTHFGFDEYWPDKSYFKWREARGLPPQPHQNRWFGEVDPFIHPSESRLAWGADRTIELLERAKEKNQPFFIRWDTSEPHLPNIVPEPFCSMYPSVPPWPGFPDPLLNKPYIQAQQRRTWELDGWTWDDWTPVVRRYLGEISLLDSQIGRILEKLEKLGLMENTLVIYSSDHGDLCGSHGMIDKHFIMYDDVVRVPLIMRWPGHISPGRTCDDFIIHSLDLAATFCDVAGTPVPPTFQGESLVQLIFGNGRLAREDVLGMYHGNQFGLYSQRMLRTRQWKYVWNATAEDELYDLVHDPGELHNRAQVAECRPVLAEMRQRLVRWLEKIHDPLLNTWTKNQLEKNLKI